jgi:hypothetical protein
MLQKDFWPLTEEHFSTLGREWGILIQNQSRMVKKIETAEKTGICASLI